MSSVLYEVGLNEKCKRLCGVVRGRWTGVSEMNDLGKKNGLSECSDKDRQTERLEEDSVSGGNQEDKN
jgi:hypothetical protein